jgi:hypothetical protein
MNHSNIKYIAISGNQYGAGVNLHSEKLPPQDVKSLKRVGMYSMSELIIL